MSTHSHFTGKETEAQRRSYSESGLMLELKEWPSGPRLVSFPVTIPSALPQPPSWHSQSLGESRPPRTVIKAVRDPS